MSVWSCIISLNLHLVSIKVENVMSVQVLSIVALTKKKQESGREQYVMLTMDFSLSNRNASLDI